MNASNGSTMTEDEYNEAMANAVADNYPGKEYRLHFNAGEAAKFVVIKPLYSEAAEGVLFSVLWIISIFNLCLYSYIYFKMVNTFCGNSFSLLI